MPSTPPQSNSLLGTLNPYSSMARSSNPPPQPADSPSTLLLRELAGDEGSEDEDPRANGADNDDDVQRDRLSPTPTPTSHRPTHVLEDEDEDEPPASIMFGDSPPRSALPSRSSTSAAGTSSRRSIERARPIRSSSGDKTPQTPRSPNPAMSSSAFRPQAHASSSKAVPSAIGRVPLSSGPSMPRPSSPGPFRNTQGPSSSSASEAGHQSESTSPGPSTISIYASGLEGTALESTGPGTRDPSLSPEKPKAPTFREVPGYRPSPSRRAPSRGSDGKLVNGNSAWQGYLDPPTGKGKGKAKEKTQSGKKYLAVPSGEVDEEDDHEMEDAPGRGKMKGYGAGRALPKSGLNEYEKALWKWVNVDDLDGFLQEVYEYYKGKGVYCIALARVLNLLTTFFVIAFSTFLLQCIDYHKLFQIHGSGSPGRLDDVLVPQCLTHGSVPHMLFIFAVSIFYIFQLFSFAFSLPRLLDIYRFYTYLLGIPDADIQTLPWPEIVRLIGDIRKHNPVTSLSNGQADALADMVGADVKGDIKKLDAHDVANRILRQENYLIALFNKDLLDLRVRLPVPHQYAHLVPASLLANPAGAALPSTHADRPPRRYISFGANTLTKALEWNLRFCLLGYLFDSQGQVRREFVRERRRKDLVDGLKRRFIFMGILNAIFAPFIIVYLLIYSFFRYFEEYRNHPSSIGSRQYTPYAQWKFREFNELPHLFETRLAQSYPIAKGYVDQFPNERSKLVMRFVAFIVGAPSAVLLVLTLLDPDLFLHFEITNHRTVLFYLGVFGSVLAIARGMIPAENLVFDPEQSLREVVRWTHYLPGEWRGRLHSRMVHADFSTLFALKISIFFTELLSVLLTPFILWFSLPPCAGAIIDFFREFTVHVDGVGYVCSFAVFDFRRHGAMKPPEPGAPISPTTALSPLGSAKPPAPVTSPTARGFGRGRDWRANENKMEKSFLHFKATHPDWQPSDPSSSVFLDRLVGMHQASLRNPMGGPQAALTSPTGAYDPNGAIGTGARGLGLALGADATLRERSRSYDRAWAKSSHLLKPKLEPMRENEPERMGESEEVPGEDGEVWNKRVRDRDDDEEDEEGFLRDVGMMGLLQQVMRR